MLYRSTELDTVLIRAFQLGTGLTRILYVRFVRILPVIVDLFDGASISVCYF